MAMQFKFDTRAYEAEHGCKPSHRTRGGWILQVTDINGWPGEMPDFTVCGTFADAKREAKRLAAQQVLAEFGPDADEVVISILP